MTKNQFPAGTPVAGPRTGSPVRLALRDDSEIVRHGLAGMMAAHASRVVLVASSLRADVTLVDPAAPHPEAEATGGGRFVLYPWTVGPEEVSLALARGYHGCLPKDLPSVTMVESLERVHRGQVVIHRPADEPSLRGTAAPSPLTPREETVLRLVTSGLSNDEITRELGLSINTLKSYIRSSYRKIEAASRSQAVLWGVRNGLLLEAPADRAARAQAGSLVRAS